MKCYTLVMISFIAGGFLGWYLTDNYWGKLTLTSLYGHNITTSERILNVAKQLEVGNSEKAKVKIIEILHASNAVLKGCAENICSDKEHGFSIYVQDTINKNKDFLNDKQNK